MNIKEAFIIAELIYSKKEIPPKNRFEVLIDKILYNLLNNKETEPIEFIMENGVTILLDISNIKPLSKSYIKSIL